MQNNRPPNPSRRDFGITSVAAATLAAGLLQGKTALADENTLTDEKKSTEESKGDGLIDAHSHVWHPDTDKYPISKNFDQSAMQPRSFTADELLSHSKPAGVDRVVLIQMSFYEYDHTYLCEVMDAHPKVFSGVALVDHRADDVARHMDELVGKGMRGFRLHSRGDAVDWIDNRNMQSLWRKATQEGLAVCPLINPTDIPYVDALCEKFPETTVVVDHFARVGISGMIESDHLDNLCRLARFKNTYVKTSAFYALGKKLPPYEDLLPMIRRVVDAFGPQRLMWASDSPFQVQGDHSYAASIALIRDRADFLSAGDKQWLLRKTAEQVFFRS